MRLDVEIKFAPCSQSAALAVRDGCSTLDDKSRLLVRESFAPSAFVNGGRGAILRLGHADESIGRIVCVASSGEWFYADAIVNVDDNDRELCARVRREVKPGARVSPGFFMIEEYRDDRAGVIRYRQAHLDDICLLADGEIAGYLGAVVTRVREPSFRIVQGVRLNRGDELLDGRGHVIARG